jgi:hypothetical protein
MRKATVSLLDGAGAVVAISQSTTDTESYSFTAGSAGSYTVRVYLYADYGTTTGNSYELALSR